jgi:hypothetical protein
MANVFRKEYRELSDEEKALLDSIKDKAQELYDLMESSVEVNPSRRASQIVIAKEKLEESVMWAVKGITG